MSLEKEFEFFKANQDQLVHQYEGKFIVIVNESVVGAYDTEIEAYEASKQNYPPGTFLIQQCLPGNESYTQTFHSRVVFHWHSCLVKYLNKNARAFTTYGAGYLPALTNKVKVSEAFTPTQTSGLSAKNLEYIAIWDTGATNTVITKKVASDLDLKPSGIAEVTSVHGKKQVHTYLINVYLPNGVAFSAVKVSEGEFVGGDVLIGMDIIRSGDFAITNFDKKTVFTFRVPSLEQMDFVKEINQSNSKYKKVTMSPEELRKNRNKNKQARRGKKDRWVCLRKDSGNGKERLAAEGEIKNEQGWE